MKRIAAGVFKARCLTLIKEVQTTGESVVITKRGAPVVEVAFVGSGNGDVFGFMAGEFDIVGDIESPGVPLNSVRSRLKAQIRKSSEEYRRGKKRDARVFLAELHGKPGGPNTKRRTHT